MNTGALRHSLDRAERAYRTVVFFVAGVWLLTVVGVPLLFLFLTGGP